MMVISIALSALAFLLICVAMAGGSNQEDNIKAAAWTIGKYSSAGISYTVYYGTVAFTASGNNGETTNWSDCSGVDYCNDCQTGGANALNCSVLTFLLSISLIVSSICRANVTWDKVCLKVSVLIEAFLALLIMIIGMGSWNSQCVENLPTSNISYSTGPGLSSMVAAFFMVLLVLLIHLLIAVERATGQSDGDFAPFDPPANKV